LHKCEPINPAPPVTKALRFAIIKFSLKRYNVLF
jgi:hypothetical protein